MQTTNSREIKEQMSLLQLVNYLGFAVVKKGEKSFINCPHHADKNPSCHLDFDKNLYHCFSCGAGGDVITMARQVRSLSMNEAMKYLGELAGVKPAVAPAAAPTTKTSIKSIPVQLPGSACWHYHNANGETVICTIRKIVNNKKQFYPHTVIGKSMMLGINGINPRPLFNLPRVIKARKIIIVEGEKCAVSLQKFIDSHTKSNYVVTTWNGGATSTKKTDWTPIRNKDKIIIWGDNDPPGHLAVEKITSIIAEHNSIIAIVAMQQEWRKGYDVADAIEDDINQVVPILKSAKEIVKQKSQPPPPPPPIEEEVYKIPSENLFKILGKNGDTYYILSVKQRELIEVQVGNLMSPTLMLRLADLSFWQEVYNLKSYNINTSVRTQFADWVISQVRDDEPFDIESVRGIGCWRERKGYIFNNGRKVYGTQSGDFQYLANRKMDTKPAKPLNNKELESVYNCIKLFSWRSEADAVIMTGWILSSIICGSLEHRPHLWLTGGAGRGKTSLITKVIVPLLGNGTTTVTLKSTLAGIRRAISNKAQATIVDECDINQIHDKDALTNLNALLRMTSSEGGKFVMADVRNSTGTCSTTLQTAFMLSSIYKPNLDDATQSRIASVEMVEPMGERATVAYWTEIMKPAIEKITEPEFANRLRWTVIKNMKEINENCIKCSILLNQIVTSNIRSSDLHGTLAAAFSFAKNGVVKEEKQLSESVFRIAQWIKNNEEQTKKESAAAVFETIATTKIRRGNVEYTISGLIFLIQQSERRPQRSYVGLNDDYDDTENIYRLLHSNGVRILENNKIAIALKSKVVNDAIDHHTPISGGRWATYIERMGGENKRIRYPENGRLNSIIFPMDFLNIDNNDEKTQRDIDQ